MEGPESIIRGGKGLSLMTVLKARCSKKEGTRIKEVPQGLQGFVGKGGAVSESSCFGKLGHLILCPFAGCRGRQG